MNPPSKAACYHCGSAVPPGLNLSVTVEGQQMPMCCHGCQTVTEAILAGGLGEYYRHRTANVATPQALPVDKKNELALFNREDVQQDFLRVVSPTEHESVLIINGITCAACIWLLEHFASEMAGVLSLHVNHSTHRAVVTWNPAETGLGDILTQLHKIGYPAFPYHPNLAQELQEKQDKQMLIRICVAGFGMMQSMMFAIPLYLHLIEDISGSMIDLFRWFSLVLTLPVIAYSANPFTLAAWRDLKMRRLTMDVPVALALWLAFLASFWVTLYGGREVYYESVCMFTFLLLLSRYIERKVRLKGSQSTNQLFQNLPAAAIRIDEGRETIVAARDLKAGDRIRVKPGEILPADGRIIEGNSSVNEAALTGEYLPVRKQPGAGVIGGTVNVDSPLIIEVTAVGEQSQMSAITRIMERASRERPPVATLADRVARYFVSTTLIVSVLVGWYWWQQDPQEAFRIVLSILVVTCPCALSLATPTALTAATTALRQRGFLVVRSHVLEGIANATTFVFDKTGTLTEGRLVIEDMLVSDRYSRDQVLEMAAALEFHSVHPIAAAFRPYQRFNASNVETVSGAGVQGQVQGRELRLGTAQYALGKNSARHEAVPADGHWIALADDREVLAWFKLNDKIRPESAAVTAMLRKFGIKLVMLSGDRSSVVQEVGKTLGFDQVQSGCSPEDKLQALQQLQDAGEQVVMIGDGINDVPGMAGAHLSIAMNNASDLTRLNADAILLSGNLSTLSSAVSKARRTKMIIRENLGWSLLYNVLALPLAVMGLVEPWQAAIGMSVSSLIVVLNALRLSERSDATAKGGNARMQQAIL